MIHLRPIPETPRKRCDTRALLQARARVRADLELMKAEKNEPIDTKRQRRTAHWWVRAD
jgi:hypothetical protein